MDLSEQQEERAKTNAQRPVMQGWGRHLGTEWVWESEQEKENTAQKDEYIH